MIEGGRRRPATRALPGFLPSFRVGYDIGTYQGIDRMLKESDKAVGKRRLKALHLNDSKEPLGSRRDRHEDIGKGEIGETGFA